MIKYENLKILRDALVKHHDTVSKSFDMNIFRDEGYDVVLGEAMTPEHVCGTHGCVVGWMPFLGVEEFVLTKDDVWSGLGGYEVDYDSYSNKHIFGLDPKDRISSKNALIWAFLFSDYWGENEKYSSLDNAIERIDMVLEHGYDVLNMDSDMLEYFKESYGYMY